MGAWWSPGRSPSKHADGFNRQRFAAARTARQTKAAGAKARKHKAHLQERLQRSSSPSIASAVLAAPVREQRPVRPCWRESSRTFSARGGGVNRKMDKLTQGQLVASGGRSRAENFNRR